MLGLVYTPVQKPQPPAQVVQSYANGLHVTADAVSPNLVDNTIEWRGSVVATYGPSTLSADRIIVHNDPDNPYGEAIGNIKLLDPEGTITASYVKFFWKTRTGSGKDIAIVLGQLSLKAESVDLQPDLWTLHNVGGTGCKLKTPLYYIHAREVQVRPGVGVRAIRPSLSILGHRMVTVPYEKYALGGESNSISLPYPTIRSGGAFGINWTNQFSIDPKDSLYTKYAVFQRSLPYYNATFLRSGISGIDPEPLRTEIGDRFSFGYFDNVHVRDPQSERNYVGSRRLDFGLESTFGADARDTTNSTAKINKPIEAIGQASGTVHGFGILGLARAQEIQVGNAHQFSRLITEENVLSPNVRIGKNLSVYARGDAAEFTGGNRFGWVRGQTGVVFNLNQNIRLGTSYTSVKAHGTPDFAYDEPLRFRELGLRADFDYDTTQIRILLKYDPSQRAIFDREFYISRVVGCIEPYIEYRERPHKFFVGIKLPITRSLDRLLNVASEREKAISESTGHVSH